MSDGQRSSSGVGSSDSYADEESTAAKLHSSDPVEVTSGTNTKEGNISSASPKRSPKARKKSSEKYTDPTAFHWRALIGQDPHTLPIGWTSAAGDINAGVVHHGKFRDVIPPGLVVKPFFCEEIQQLMQLRVLLLMCSCILDIRRDSFNPKIGYYAEFLRLAVN